MKARRTWLVVTASLLVVLPLGAICVVWLGASASLDWQYRHSTATQTLPTQATGTRAVIRIPTGKYAFRARIAGVGGARGNLILLHGFAESSTMWQPLITTAAQAGYQVLAFDQRGYSPGARPEDAASYTLAALAKDVHSVARARGFRSFHLVGHGWGALVGWQLVLGGGDKPDTWTALSMPHGAAFQQARDSDPEQRRRSRYLEFMMLPWLPEQILAFNRFEILRQTLWQGRSEQQVAEYTAILGEPGALRAVTSWFRAPASAMPPHATLNVPTLLVWGNRDPFLAPSTVAGHRALVAKSAAHPVRELELDGGHRLLGSHTKLVTDAILKHLQSPDQ